MKSCALKYIGSAPLLLLLLTFPLAAQTPTAPTADEANALFQAERWDDAAGAYAALSKLESANGRVWFRLGQSLQRAGKHEPAIAAFLQAVKKVQPANRKLVMYGLATAYAKLNDKERALQWLGAAVKAGFDQPGQMNADTDLVALSADARFKELAAQAKANAHPCTTKQEYHQFDFWLGAWDVQDSTGQPGAGQTLAASNIQRIIDSCVVYENYAEGNDFSGKSFNFYDANLHKWRQTWVDNTGRISEFIGEYKEGAMRFAGESHLPDGTKVLRHMTLFNLGADRVRQLSEASVDGGQTWQVNYDYTYVRKK